jgi:AcrR family transcriptional regulator
LATALSTQRRSIRAGSRKISTQNASTPLAADLADRTQAARRARTRLRIIDAGRTLFARDGYSVTTIDRITAEAGVGRATFYLHFVGKLELLQAIFEDFRGHFMAVMGALHLHVAQDESAVCAWIRLYIDVLSSQKTSVNAVSAALREGVDSILERQGWYGLALDIFARTIPAFRLAISGQDEVVSARAQLLLFQLDGFATACAMGRWTGPSDATAVELARIIMAFVRDNAEAGSSLMQ